MHGSAEQLARGAQKASYTQSTHSALFFDIQMGMGMLEVMAKYGLAQEVYDQVLEAYLAGNDELLAQYLPMASATDPAIPLEPAPVILAEPTKSEYVYRGTPRLDQILIKRASKEHSSQLIIPDAYKDNSDIGFIVSVGPDVTDLEKGLLVMFDKYATVGQAVRLVDEDGDEVEMLLMKSINVQLTLTRLRREDL